MQIPTPRGGRREHAPVCPGTAILFLEPFTVKLQEELVNRCPVVGQDPFRFALQVGLEEGDLHPVQGRALAYLVVFPARDRNACI